MEMFEESIRLTIGQKTQLLRLAHERSSENNATFEQEYILGKIISRMASIGTSEESIKARIDEYYTTR